MKLYLTLLVFCFAFTACKKEHQLSEEEKKVIEVNKTKLYGHWNFVSASKGPLFVTNADPCYADNWLEFRQGGEGTISQGTCIDNPPIHETQDFKWSFKDTVNIDFGDNEIRLVKLNDSALVFKVLHYSNGASNDEFSWKK